MLTTKQAFQAGFLYRCAELGLSAEAAEKLAEKAAFIQDVKDVVSTVAAPATAGLKAFSPYLLPLAAFGPPVAGYGLGHLAHAATDADSESEKDIMRRELIEEYRQATQELKEKYAPPTKKKRVARSW